MHRFCQTQNSVRKEKKFTLKIEEQLRKRNVYIYLMYYNQSVNEEFFKTSMLK